MGSAISSPSDMPRKTTQPPALNLPSNKVRVIIMKAREFDARQESADLEIEEGAPESLIDETQSDDPAREELLSAIRALNEDERIRLVALAWLGRGTYDLDEWREAVAVAKSEHSRRTAEYLTTMPLLAEYLEDGLAVFEESSFEESDKKAARRSRGQDAGATSHK